jgi:glycosyltransferase involved in cell wall biosynthesis
VDTDLFKPVQDDETLALRNLIRDELGVTKNEVLCIYSGRFSIDKNPHCLAKAIDRLQSENLPFKGIFVGNGAQRDIDFIKSMRGCMIQPFVPVKDLPKYYRAADIGVWPREESTSQLDGAVCGLPLVLSNKIRVFERVEGNGLLYEEGDHIDLARKLAELQNPELRKKMSAHGIQKIKRNFSWDVIAEKRITDYTAVLN